ncbi:RNA export factor gle2 [Mucor velutinosus]|uniref:Conserved oligomeric Golgi complex subunit 1 n=1 Tax=Mucor velutinosus TaxID=708070 RepID=A0AAN7I2U5_9FUNG|nr:RNA export factor gle2 [Mucor velutinosus]
MSKNAQAIQSNFERMQQACDVDRIKQSSRKTLQLRDEKNNQIHIDTKRKYIYVIAALVKSLADVPEQIWHALENHRYLHASRLYILAKQVHAYLEQEKGSSTIDIEVAFPVIQRQWDAVSAFGPQIIQRATHYLRVSEQATEHIAEVIVALMLLDDQTYAESINKLLEMRSNVIRDILQQYTKTTDSANHRITHQLREVSLIIKRTLVQVFDIFVSKEGGHQQTLIESYIESFLKTFLIPSKSSHGNETPSQPAITRLFSPSSNVHLIVRYLPESIQNYTPSFDPSPHVLPSDVQQHIAAWMEEVKAILNDQLPHTLAPIHNQAELTQVRSKLWELLDEDENTRDKTNKWQITAKHLLSARYSLWTSLYRNVFNDCSKKLIDTALADLAKQPAQVVWPLIMDPKKQRPRRDFSLTMKIWPSTAKHQAAFALPNLSSSQEIEGFKASLKETANDRTDKLGKLQACFDTALHTIRKDVQQHFIHTDQEHFHAKDDMGMIKSYFQDQCYQAVLKYATELASLAKQMKDWTDQRMVNEVSIFLGRLARNIGLLSKELPKAISLSIDDNKPVFELRSSINKDAKYISIQNTLLDTYHEMHTSWIQWLEKEFGQKLKSSLVTSKWNDHCAAIAVWETVEEDMKLPTQASNMAVRTLFYVCEEIQRINSSVVDQSIMTRLRQHLSNTFNQVIQSSLPTLELTENGTLQLMFDYLFLCTVLQQDVKYKSDMMDIMKQQIDPINWESYQPHMKPCVDRFYIKQSLLFGVLTSASNETYERARKTMSTQQQGQYNVLPLAPQATRFTLLPIGHASFSSLKAR